ncbi:MAG: hypothetical protein ACP5N7_05870 [Candidatus Pacearchaeota archaeon]
MFKDNLEGQTFSCTHENTIPNGMCAKCLSKAVKELGKVTEEHLDPDTNDPCQFPADGNDLINI